MQRYSVVAFLARQHGIDTLKHLLKSDEYEIKYLFTHHFNPKEGRPERTEREELAIFQSLANEHHIPLMTVDSKAEVLKCTQMLKEMAPFDYILSVSWKRIIPTDQLALPNYPPVNLHRGDLPQYPGLYPVERALRNGDQEIIITSHVMSEEIDAGEIIDKVSIPANFDQSTDLLENVERLKIELSPLFGPLAIDSFEKLRSNHD